MLYVEVNIEEMITQADIICTAKLLDEKKGIAQEMPYVEYTFEVTHWYGSNQQSQVTIRQLGKQTPKKEIILFPGLPSFQKGQEYLLFLKNPSALGFSSPLYLLTFELVQKKGQPSSKQLIPNRTAKGLFDNVQNLPMKNLIQNQNVKEKFGQGSGLDFSTMDQLIRQVRP